MDHAQHDMLAMGLSRPPIEMGVPLPAKEVSLDLDMETLIDRIKKHEGTKNYNSKSKRHRMYLDKVERKNQEPDLVPTIGYGTNIRDNPRVEPTLVGMGYNYLDVLDGTQDILDKDAVTLLQTVVKEDSIEDAKVIFGRSVYNNLSAVRKAVLVSMAYQLGRDKLNGFIEMKKAIKAGDWSWAAKEMRDSRWFHQSGTRAKRHYFAMFNNEYIPTGILGDLTVLKTEREHLKAYPAFRTLGKDR